MDKKGLYAQSERMRAAAVADLAQKASRERAEAAVAQIAAGDLRRVGIALTQALLVRVERLHGLRAGEHPEVLAKTAGTKTVGRDGNAIKLYNFDNTILDLGEGVQLVVQKIDRVGTVAEHMKQGTYYHLELTDFNGTEAGRALSSRTSESHLGGIDSEKAAASYAAITEEDMLRNNLTLDLRTAENVQTIEQMLGLSPELPEGTNPIHHFLGELSLQDVTQPA